MCEPIYEYPGGYTVERLSIRAIKVYIYIYWLQWHFLCLHSTTFWISTPNQGSSLFYINNTSEIYIYIYIKNTWNRQEFGIYDHKVLFSWQLSISLSKTLEQNASNHRLVFCVEQTFCDGYRKFKRRSYQLTEDKIEVIMLHR